MTRVEVVFTNGQRRAMLLAGIPRIGDSIRLRNGPDPSPSYVVEHVLWTEGSGEAPEPSVMVVVRKNVESPNG